MKSKQATARNYHWHFEFRVGGKKYGYDCNAEVTATNRIGAAQKIRNRIRAMPDVVAPPKFHYTEIRKGLPVLASGGHTTTRLVDFKRPGVIATPQWETEEQWNDNYIDASALREPTANDLYLAAVRRRSGMCATL